MAQQGLDEAQEKESKEFLTPPDKAKLLLEMDFQETDKKPGLWYKQLDPDTAFFWSFQKTKKGSSWCNRKKNGTNIRIPEADKKAMAEYTYIRQIIVSKMPDTKSKKPKAPSGRTVKDAVLEEKGDAYTLMNLKDDNQVMDEIRGRYLSEFVYNFKTKTGDVTGLSWAGTKEIARMQGNISVEDLNITETPDTYRVLAKAKDIVRNVTMFGIAEQAKNMTLKSGNKVEDLHALSKCVSRAQRNAIRALIPEMFIKEMIRKFTEGN